jgi:hypothetical protein
MRSGDIILDVAGKSGSAPSDVSKEIADLHKAGKHTVLMRVKSNSSSRFRSETRNSTPKKGGQVSTCPHSPGNSIMRPRLSSARTFYKSRAALERTAFDDLQTPFSIPRRCKAGWLFRLFVCARQSYRWRSQTPNLGATWTFQRISLLWNDIRVAAWGAGRWNYGRDTASDRGCRNAGIDASRRANHTLGPRQLIAQIVLPGVGTAKPPVLAWQFKLGTGGDRRSDCADTFVAAEMMASPTIIQSRIATS